MGKEGIGTFLITPVSRQRGEKRNPAEEERGFWTHPLGPHVAGPSPAVPLGQITHSIGCFQLQKQDNKQSLAEPVVG